MIRPAVILGHLFLREKSPSRRRERELRNRPLTDASSQTIPFAERTSSAQVAVCLFVLVLFSCSGCRSTAPKIDVARNAFALGDLSAAAQTLQELAESDAGQAVTSSLDLAIVELASGNQTAAERRLRGLRDQFDQLPAFSPVSEAASIASDDNARGFRPAGYEEVMVRTMLAICSLAGDGGDAESYALQANMKQNELAIKATDRGIADVANLYQPLAVAPYIRGIIREATHHDYDDAARAYQLVSAVRPDFAPAQVDIQRASVGTHSAAGHGVLYVIACVGRGPVLCETTAPTTSTALAIASVALRAEANEDSDSPTPPVVSAVKVPAVTIPDSPVAAVDVTIGGQLYGTTQTLTDVGQLASNQVAAEMPWTIARAVMRRITKETTVAGVSEQLGLRGTARFLFQFAASTAWTGSEHADTRCWGLLPREIQVLRAELPAGPQHVQLSAVGYGGESYAEHSRSVQIADGRNHYLIAIAPDQAIYVVGQ